MKLSIRYCAVCERVTRQIELNDTSKVCNEHQRSYYNAILEYKSLVDKPEVLPKIVREYT